MTVFIDGNVLRTTNVSFDDVPLRLRFSIVLSKYKYVGVLLLSNELP